MTSWNKLEANNAKARKMLDKMDKLKDGYKPYNVDEM